jgi:hypothetical protein
LGSKAPIRFLNQLRFDQLLNVAGVTNL